MLINRVWLGWRRWVRQSVFRQSVSDITLYQAIMFPTHPAHPPPPHPLKKMSCSILNTSPKQDCFHHIQREHRTACIGFTLLCSFPFNFLTSKSFSVKSMIEKALRTIFQSFLSLIENTLAHRPYTLRERWISKNLLVKQFYHQQQTQPGHNIFISTFLQLV